MEYQTDTQARTQALTTAHAAPSAAALAPLDLGPRTFEQALQFAEYLADSELVPKDYRGKPGNCLIAMQWGAELGLKPLQALQNIAAINGRPALWGDAVLALVRASPLCEFVIESDDGQAATCRVKRRGEPEQSRTFSVDDARAAGLLGKQGPWTQYPKRMRQMRARAFALRDVFADVLRGLPVAEEVMDATSERHMGMVDEVRQPSAPAAPALPPYSDADFEINLPKWQKLIDAGKKTPSELLATLRTRATFSEAQQARVLSLRASAQAKSPPDASAQAQQQEAIDDRVPQRAHDDWAAAYDAAEGGAQ